MLSWNQTPTETKDDYACFFIVMAYVTTLNSIEHPLVFVNKFDYASENIKTIIFPCFIII
jgi:hypothetical protein